MKIKIASSVGSNDEYSYFCPMRKYQHLFFDLDRTLYDFDANNRNALYSLYRQYELWKKGRTGFDRFMNTYHPINLGLWDDYKQKKITKKRLNVQRFAQTFKALGMDDSMAEDFASDYLKISPEQTRLMPGTLEVLACLKNKYTLHIITNGFDEIQYQKISRCGLGPYFTTVTTSEQAGAQKPDALIFDLALQSAGASPEHSLLIGDDPESDIRGAKQQGIDQVWLAQDGEESPVEPTYTIHSLRELINLL